MMALAATTKRLLVHLRPHHRYSLRHLCSSGKDHITSQSIIGESTDSDTTLPSSICANETKENPIKDGNNFVGEKLMSLRINNRELKDAENYKSWGRKRAYFGSSRELHSDTRQDLNASKPMTTNHLTTKENKSMADNLEHLLCDLKRNKTLMAENLAHIKELECKKDKSMADNSMLVEELESLLWDVDGNETLMAENLAHIKELECKNEELMADNLNQVKKLDFSLGFNLLDEYMERNLEIARNLDPSDINGNDQLMTNLELSRKLDYVNKELAEIIMDLSTEVNFVFSRVEENYEFTPDNMELLKNDELMADNLELARKLDLAIRKINANNKLMAFNLELVKTMDSILEKSDAKDDLMASLERDIVTNEFIVKNLEIIRKLDVAVEKIDVNDKWIVDNLKLIRKLDIVVKKINENDKLVKENLELVKKRRNENEKLKADNLDKVWKSVVAVKKFNVNEALWADIKKSQVDLGKITANDLFVAGYLEIVKMLARTPYAVK